MSEIIKGKFRYEQDSKNFHRFQIEVENKVVVGTVYISREIEEMPKKLILEYAEKDDSIT